MAEPRKRTVAIALAVAGWLVPGLHKFYLKQYGWGVAYLLLWWTMIPCVASLVEAVWYLSQDRDEFDRNFNRELSPARVTVNVAVDPDRVSAVGEALRELDRLRQEGLISESEFEQKRRLMLDQIG
jgi:TM2 domain-containing membrane protein YozV